MRDFFCTFEKLCVGQEPEFSLVCKPRGSSKKVTYMQRQRTFSALPSECVLHVGQLLGMWKTN